MTIARRRGRIVISQIRKAFLGTAGHDLVDRWQAVSELPSYIVNRAGKSDRLADLKPFAVPTKTVSLRLNDLADTPVAAYSVCAGPHHQAGDAAAESEP